MGCSDPTKEQAKSIQSAVVIPNKTELALESEKVVIGDKAAKPDRTFYLRNSNRIGFTKWMEATNHGSGTLSASQNFIDLHPKREVGAIFGYVGTVDQLVPNNFDDRGCSSIIFKPIGNSHPLNLAFIRNRRTPSATPKADHFDDAFALDNRKEVALFGPEHGLRIELGSIGGGLSRLERPEKQVALADTGSDQTASERNQKKIKPLSGIIWWQRGVASFVFLCGCI